MKWDTWLHTNTHRFWSYIVLLCVETTKWRTITVRWISEVNETALILITMDCRGMWQDKNNLCYFAWSHHTHNPLMRERNVSIKQSAGWRTDILYLFIYFYKFFWINAWCFQMNFSAYVRIYVWSMFEVSLTETGLHMHVNLKPTLDS